MNKPQRGFTLLEVVVAAALLGIGLAVAMQVFSGGLRNMYRIDEAHRAMNHAENVMNEYLADADIREPYSESGDLDEDFSYSVRIDYWQDDGGQTLQPLGGSVAAGPNVYLLSVVVEVHFKKSERGRLYRLVSLKAVSETPAGTPGADVIRRIFGRQR